MISHGSKKQHYNMALGWHWPRPLLADRRALPQWCGVGGNGRKSRSHYSTGSLRCIGLYGSLNPLLGNGYQRLGCDMGLVKDIVPL